MAPSPSRLRAVKPLFYHRAQSALVLLDTFRSQVRGGGRGGRRRPRGRSVAWTIGVKVL